MPAPLALVGSGEFTASMRSVDTLLLANGTGRRVLVVPTAAAADGTEAVAAVVRAAQEHFASLGAEVVVSGVRERSDAVREAALPDDVDVIYLPGGNAGHVARVLVGTPFAEALVAAWRRGLPLAAASASAVLLGSCVYDPEDPKGPARLGIGVLDAAVIPHWQEVSQGRPEFVARVRREQPQVLVLDEATAAVHDGSGWMVTGQGGALVTVGPQLRPLDHEDLPPLPASVLM
jgi:cyanophycinase-like exopeptidase